MTDEVTAPAHRPLAPRTGAVLVFGSSAAVLVVELVALRLLAPYIGLTLETNTLVIGIALSAIAFGSWAGGRAADVTEPRRTLGPLLGVSGLAVGVTPLVVRLGGAADGALVLLAGALCLFVPAALLSAVTPMVTKLLLTDLAETGAVVGRLSGIGTAGGIAGTVVTGFVLISVVPVSAILLGLGVLLVLAAVAVDLRVRGWCRPREALVLVLVLGGATALTQVAPGGCDAETTYHCAQVQADPERDGGRLLVLDGLGHSYVDVDDPTYLHFAYVEAIASLVDTGFPAQEPLDAYHLGAGALTVPRYLAAERPGSRSLVSEIDAGVIRVGRERLGIEPDASIDVRVEDGRLGLGRVEAGSRDLVVGDAFGGVSVPWHLTTREAVTAVERLLRPEGVYVLNVIDHGPLGFARAEVATLRERFAHVAVAAEPGAFDGTDGGNLVVAASQEPLDLRAWEARLGERESSWRVVGDGDLDDWVGDAEVLTDDDAPVDQLLTPYRSS